MYFIIVVTIAFLKISAAQWQSYGDGNVASHGFQSGYYDGSSAYNDIYSGDPSTSQAISEYNDRYSALSASSSSIGGGFAAASSASAHNSRYPDYSASVSAASGSSNRFKGTSVASSASSGFSRAPPVAPTVPKSGKRKSKKIRPVPQAESTFIDTFTQAVYASRALTQLLDFSHVTAAEHYESTYRTAVESHIKWGMTHAEAAANLAVRNIAKFPNLSLDSMTRIYSSLVAHYLYTEEILNEENAQSLAWSFAENMESSTNQVLKLLPDYQSQAVNHGFLNFLSSFVQFNEGKGWKLAAIFQNAWQQEAMRLGLP